MIRLYCSFGDAKSTKSDKLAQYGKAMDYAGKAKDVGSTLAEVWFRYGVRMGKVGQTRGTTSSVSMAVLIENAFLKAVGLNPDHTGTL